MSEENVEIAEVPALEQVATAAPDTNVNAPEEKPVEAAKTFTQEELDAAIGKRLAREQRKWERMQSQKAAPPPVVDVPPMEQFGSPEAYAEALAAKKAQELVQEREEQRYKTQLLDAYHEREEEARGKYDDFEQVAYNPALPITAVMAETIQASEIGPDVVYYLGANPKEADRIARLTPFMQAKEIGRIEAKLADAPLVKKTTNAPAPIAPVTPRGGAAAAFDTTDPRSIKSMSTSEWIEADRQRQIRKWEAQEKFR
ncbi:MAG: hypothetical protein ACR2K1_04215 [Saprospiraceae bacterium]